MLGLLVFVITLLLSSCFAETEVLHLAPTTLSPGDQFGYFTAASGNLLVVTAPYTNSSTGAAYVFNCTSPASCVQTQILTASDGAVNDTFGYTVAVSGSLVVIGALKANLQGAAYVFDCSDPTACAWQSTITLENGMPSDQLSYYAFAYDTWVFLGAPGRNNFSGEAILYDCSDPMNCTVETSLTSPDSSPGDWFGSCTGLYGWLAVVGAEGKNNFDGSAYAYNCSNSSACTLIATLNPVGINGGAFGAFFFVFDNIIYITAAFNFNTTGATFIYNCSDSSSSTSPTTACPLVSTLQPPDLAVGDQFGAFVVAYEEVLVVCAQYQNEGRGAAYVFDCSDASNCTQTNYLNASDASAGAYFGFTLAITDTYIVATAPFADANRGEMYTYWENQTSTAP